ncbi:hypothetical protein LTR37_015913 [Vermiconidia calcicola]|uniref:Uncharacterized protein n=1 Tax=Vermiconidia calcicola TaxID=1690605 RepID=A0ACC3MPA9_9PEZI|nr:hypothetical protein LTR37_015913 [Vermiconidia calcicola]
MGDAGADVNTSASFGGFGLQTDTSARRMSLISELRSRGVGDHINLPQLVVSGDQSTGKSSVLEGITGLPFPRQDGLCTRFPTEIILEHTAGLDPNLVIVASIIPDSLRDEQTKSELQKYRRALESFEELSSVITEVGALLGLAGYADIQSGPAFGKDILRVRVQGDTGLNLSVVDLPGIIQVPNEEQDDSDVDTVHGLVDSYAANPRTIILAVVQAGNDIANQPIIKKSKKFDVAGERTIGVITKPDLINEGTQARIAALARNEDTTKLKLGFFLLKNPSPSEMGAGVRLAERERRELTYFSSPLWKDHGLDQTRTGVAALRTFLQDVLDRHTERELPKVREEVRGLLKSIDKDLAALGEERPTTGQMRMFLSRLAMRFHSLTNTALIGDYNSSDLEFFAPNDAGPRRLRAFVHIANTEFSDYMRIRGETLKIVADSSEVLDVIRDLEDVTTDHESTGQQLVTEATFKAWVKQVYARTRGRELPGNYNHVLLAELFHFQSRRWRIMAAEHVEAVFRQLRVFIECLANHISDEERIVMAVKEQVDQRLANYMSNAEAELATLLDDENQQPITYNHYYTDNVQKSRQADARKLISDIMQETAADEWNGALHISNNGVDVKKLINALQQRVEVDMDEQACTEARAGLDAYCKVTHHRLANAWKEATNPSQVARKTFVDNVCKQVIERHLLRPLPSLFSPEIVAGYSEADLHNIAAESSQVLAKRAYLQDLRETLTKSLTDLSHV